MVSQDVLAGWCTPSTTVHPGVGGGPFARYVDGESRSRLPASEDGADDRSQEQALYQASQ